MLLETAAERKTIPKTMWHRSRHTAGGAGGTQMLSAILGGAMGPSAAGVLHDLTGSYAPAFWISIGLNVMSAVAIFRAARPWRANNTADGTSADTNPTIRATET